LFISVLCITENNNILNVKDMKALTLM